MPSEPNVVLGEDMIKKITKCSRLQSALGVVKKTKLIHCVRQRPCLWDYKCEDFKYTTARQNAFSEIVKELSDEENKYTRTQMQEEWGKIRYCFTRIMKKLLTTNDDADAISWPHWEDMQFMYDQIRENLLNGGRKSPCDNSPNASCSMADDRNIRKRRLPRASLSSSKRFSDNSSSGKESAVCLETNESISQEAAKALFHLGLAGNAEESSFAQNIAVLPKSEAFSGDDDGRASTSVSPAGDRLKWETFVSSINVRPDTLTTLMLGNDSSKMTQNGGHLLPSNSSVAGEQLYNGNSLPSIENVEAIAARSDNDGDTDTNEFFGKYMIQQMKAVSKRNPTLGVLLRKELMEVCCKYELQTFSS